MLQPDLDTDPVTDGLDDYLENEVVSKMIFGRQRDVEARKRHLNMLFQEFVFFNHFTWVETTIRPSTLVKAWNRCAAIMTKGAIGIDFIIPVMFAGKLMDEKELGPMFGVWSDKQEQLAESVIGYILIQTKARKDSSPGDVKASLANCIAITSKDKNQPVPNFMMHNPFNPFVSILMELGCVREAESRVQVNNTTDYNAFRKLETDFKRRETDSKQRLSLPDHQPMFASKESKDEITTETLKKEARIIENERNRLSIREQQLPIVAYGLDAETYKCLEGRESVIRWSNQLLDDTRNPVRGLKDEPVLAALIRMGHHIAMNPMRESIFHGGIA